jgi:hypothetical protein
MAANAMFAEPLRAVSDTDVALIVMVWSLAGRLSGAV